ncbi:MAG: hypothetical protein PHY25_04890 [Dehalococcoidales bacterium]|nr:hypothetical protein [Dehalococcoidales bacterium]
MAPIKIIEGYIPGSIGRVAELHWIFVAAMATGAFSCGVLKGLVLPAACTTNTVLWL